MNKLSDLDWSYEPSKRVGPQQPYLSGQVCLAMPDSLLSRYLATYFPQAHNKVIIRETHEKYDYLVIPVMYTEEIGVSHADLRPKQVYRTGYFIPAKFLQPGTLVRDLHKRTYVLTHSESLEPVEILVEKRHLPLSLEAFLLEEYYGKSSS